MIRRCRAAAGVLGTATALAAAGPGTPAKVDFPFAPAMVGAATSSASGEVAFVPGEALVRFKDRVDDGRRTRTLESAGAGSEEKLPVPGLWLVELAGDSPVRETTDELEQDRDVAYAEPNFVRRLETTPNDQFFSRLWGLENSGQTVNGTAGTPDADIDAASGWDRTSSSEGIQVAVVDDGIAYDHPDLAANVWSNPGETGAGEEANGADDDGNGYVDDVRGWDFADVDRDPRPVGADGDHGTHVAGTIGAVGDNSVGVTGVAWRTDLMALRIFDEQGFTTTARIVSAFDYARQNGAEVVNGSFGGGGRSQAELDSITRAAPDTLFVFAAGNQGTDNDAQPTYPCNFEVQNLLCVAAGTQDDTLASFSNFGDQSVDLAAPGTNILSTYPEELTPSGFLPYAYMSGTSMATPVVSGAASLVLAVMPDATGGDVATRLRQTVDQRPALVGVVASGGRLNLTRALAGSPPAGPLLPVAPSPVAPAPSEPSPVEEPELMPSQGVDMVPPETRVTTRPEARTRDRTPSFRFRSSEPDSVFRCSLDRRRFKACRARFTTPRLSLGRHALRVVAVDATGNDDPTPAADRFKVVD